MQHPRSHTCSTHAQVARRVKLRLEAKLLGSADADPIRFTMPGYRARLYEQRFGASPGRRPLRPSSPPQGLPAPVLPPCGPRMISPVSGQLCRVGAPQRRASGRARLDAVRRCIAACERGGPCAVQACRLCAGDEWGGLCARGAGLSAITAMPPIAHALVGS